MKIIPNNNVVYKHLQMGYENLLNNNAKKAIHHFSHALYEGRQNPTITKLIDKTIRFTNPDYVEAIEKPATINLGIIKVKISNPIAASVSKTIEKLKSSKRLTILLKQYKENNNKLYPKTSKLRKKIIEEGRIILPDEIRINRMNEWLPSLNAEEFLTKIRPSKRLKK